MAYHRFDEVAGFLPNNPSPEWVLKQIIDPDRSENGSWLFILAAWFCQYSEIKMFNRDKKEPESVCGWFNIGNLWEGKGFSIEADHIVLLGGCEVLDLSNERYEFYPYEDIKIPFDSLRLHHEEIESFIRQIERSSLIIRHQVTEASTILIKKRTEERDSYVEKIMVEIDKVIREEIKSLGNRKMINHIRFIREANVPGVQFESVKIEVAKRIKNTYGNVGITSLKRRPKKNEEDYLL